MKGSAITGPVAKECADLWPRIASASGTVGMYKFTNGKGHYRIAVLTAFFLFPLQFKLHAYHVVQISFTAYK